MEMKKFTSNISGIFLVSEREGREVIFCCVSMVPEPY